MGKRSDFARRPQDAYDTPAVAVEPLLQFVTGKTYVEPCAGMGALRDALSGFAHCCLASDIEPRAADVVRWNAFDIIDRIPVAADLIITNPPWTREVLHPMIEAFRHRRPTWLLFDADWAHTRQAAPYLPYCHKIVSVGRVKWIKNSLHTGKDNAAWYLFDHEPAETAFVGRVA